MRHLSIRLTLLFIFFASILSNTAIAKKDIEIEDLYKRYTFQQKYIYGLTSMNDGLHYSELNMKRNSINKYSYVSGEKVETIFNTEDHNITDFNWIYDYEFSADESKILLSTNYAPIYRHSFKAEYYIYDIKENKVSKLSDKGLQQLAGFSPDGSKISFVRDNNIFVKDITLENSEEIQLTFDGEYNKILNGAPDWVYEEEFSYNKAYDWSADSKKIAFLKSDESNVKMFSFTLFGDLYTKEQNFKYPKAGEDNSVVSLHIVDTETKKITNIDLGDLNDKYIPRLKFTKDANLLSAVKLNRLQNEYELFIIDANTGTSSVILTLKDQKYIEINDDLEFCKDNKHFITSHESDGFRHIYYYDINGKLIKQLSSGNWEIQKIFGIDEEKGIVYFQASKSAAYNKEIYSIDLSGNNLKLLSERLGTNDANFSSGFKYFINTWNDANSPNYVTLNDSDGKEIRVLESNKVLVDKINNKYNFSQKEFFSFTTEEGVELNGWMIKPPKFKKNKKHPVLMYVYGGPGSQTVLNSWDSNMGWWQYLAQNGYIIVSVDNRGTGARGKDFRQTTYEQLGKYEVIDQIEAAKYLASQKYVNKDRIGIFGWSFGGYMSSLCLTIGAEWFKLGIAVAPVTNWRYYDSVYTERYNGMPQDNAKGYDENSPIHHSNKMKGKFMLIHGTADDNVHFQNAVDFSSKLIDSDVDFEMMYYPNKDHGIYGGNTRNHLYKKMTKFIFNNL